MKKERKEKHFIKKPVYPGGLKAMRLFIAKELKYPAQALENKTEGTVRLKYDIDYKGNVVAVFIQTSIGDGCDEEAERIVRKLKFHVDKTRKMRVIFHKTIQINFRLPKEKPVKELPKKPPIIKQVSYNYTTAKPKQISEKVTSKNATVYTYTVKINK